MYRHCVPHTPGLCGSAGHSAQCQPVWRAPARNFPFLHPAKVLPWHRSYGPTLHGLVYHPLRPHVALTNRLHRAQQDALQTTEDPLPNGAVNMLQAALGSIDLPGGSSLDSMDADDVLASLDGASDDGASHEHHHSAASVGRAVYEVLRVDPSGKTRRIYVRRRDLLRGYCLQPRDLRRIDPSLTPTKTSPSVTIKEEALLVNMCGVRAIISAGKCLLFEPNSSSSRRFLELVTPRLQSNAGELMIRAHQQARGVSAVVEEPSIPPFELEMLEGALLVATGRLDNELLAVTRRVAASLQKLPKDINPVNLEELRRVKQVPCRCRAALAAVLLCCSSCCPCCSPCCPCCFPMLSRCLCVFWCSRHSHSSHLNHPHSPPLIALNHPHLRSWLSWRARQTHCAACLRS